MVGSTSKKMEIHKLLQEGPLPVGVWCIGLCKQDAEPGFTDPCGYLRTRIGGAILKWHGASSFTTVKKSPDFWFPVEDSDQPPQVSQDEVNHVPPEVYNRRLQEAYKEGYRTGWWSRGNCTDKTYDGREATRRRMLDEVWPRSRAHSQLKQGPEGR